MKKKKSLEKRKSTSIRLPIGRRDNILYGTVERIYQLPDLAIPPTRYAEFLNQAIETYINFILVQHNAKTLEEASEISLREMKRLNPEVPNEDIIEQQPIQLCISAALYFNKPRNKTLKARRLYRSSEHIKYIFDSGFGDGFIPFDSHNKIIPRRVREFKQSLNGDFPNRRGRLISALLSRKKKTYLHENPERFYLNLDINSFLSTLLFETCISLQDYGSISERKEYYIIPGISVKAHAIVGSTKLPEKLVDNLEEVVKTFYKPDSIEYRKKYVERQIK